MDNAPGIILILDHESAPKQGTSTHIARVLCKEVLEASNACKIGQVIYEAAVVVSTLSTRLSLASTA